MVEGFESTGTTATSPNGNLAEEKKVDKSATKLRLKSRRTQIESTNATTTIMAEVKGTTTDVETRITIMKVDSRTTSSIVANVPTVIETQGMTRLAMTTTTEVVLSRTTKDARPTTQPKSG